MDVFNRGNAWLTFGGNRIAAAIGLEAIKQIEDEKFAERSAALGEHLKSKLNAIQSPLIRDVRGKGLLVGLEIDPEYATARTVSERL